MEEQETTSVTNELTSRWRLILGPDADTKDEYEPEGDNQRTDRALSLLYDKTENDILKRSRLRLNEWLQDIRDLFPHNQTMFLQTEAIENMGIGALLFEKEIIKSLTPDIELIKMILELKDQIPSDRMNDVRDLVRQYAAEIDEKIRWTLQNSMSHFFEKGDPTVLPLKREMDWPKTIKQNLKHYQPDLKTIILKRNYGYQRKKQGFPEIILAVDSSGSMMDSMIYSAIIASILAYIRSIKTRLILFDHQVADMSDQLEDIVDLLFHIQLGGGTNIVGVLDHIHKEMRNPEETYIFLISDLYDNRTDEGVLEKILELKKDGATVHCILSMDHRGQVRYNKSLANALTMAGIMCYSSSPAHFSDVLNQAIKS